MGLSQTNLVAESGTDQLELGEAVRNASRDGVIDDLYHANHAAVVRVCSKILRNPDDAADAAQEVFLIALESIDLDAPRSVARAWLLSVARNLCLDLLRRRKRLGKALVTLGPDAGRGADMETAVADRDFVEIVFQQLSNRERQALWQSAVESRPLADIAGRLRLSYMAAAQVLHRARRHAVQVAARVAVVFGVFNLGRQRPGGGAVLAAARLAAVAAVPLILISVQSSSPARPATDRGPATVSVAGPTAVEGSQTRSAGSPGANEVAGAPQGRLPGAVPNPDSVLPGTTATLNSATNAVRQLLRSLPSVPPVLPEPTILPSVSMLPSPLPSPPGIP
jgi:RNA polymerase sigma-70 factor (ECF subfamily)